MSKTEIIDVLAVYGDYGNIGGGCLIGVFTDKNKAESAAKGRGVLDCPGSNGEIKERKAIRDGDNVFLLELPFSIKCNEVVTPNPRGQEEPYFEIMVTQVFKSIEFMRIIRRRTHMGLKEVKDLYDKVQQEGKAKVMPFHNNLPSVVSKTEFSEWKLELEANGIATIEAV